MGWGGGGRGGSDSVGCVGTVLNRYLDWIRLNISGLRSCVRLCGICYRHVADKRIRIRFFAWSGPGDSRQMLASGLAL